MNRADLVAEAADQVGLTKKASAEVVEAIVSAISGSLAKAEKVTFIGLRTFQLRKKKARTGVNPHTKESIQIPAEKMPKCAVS